ncbi:hypothetical protein OAG35_02435, partial [bacterium]|nr:hypothetical protein [bacterium]
MAPSGGGGDADFRVMLANVLTHNLNHTEIIDCGLANGTEVIVIFELSSTLAQKLEKAWAASHPHQHVLPQDGANFGIGGYSKWPFQWLEVFDPIESVPSLEIVFEHVRLIATHPLPPMGPAGFRVRNLQLEDLVRRVCNVKEGQVGRFWSWAI